MKHMVPFVHKFHMPAWTMFDTIIPADSDDMITVVSTSWSNKEKKGDTMTIKMKDKTHYEQMRSMKRVIHINEKKAIAFHDKMVKEAGECPKYTL